MTDDSIQRILGGNPDRPILTFERRYRTDPDDLWQAITSPDRLARWFGRLDTPVPKRVGDAFRVHLGGDEKDRADGVITSCRRPEHLAYEWSWQDERPSRVEVALAPDGDHTTLLLTHRLAEREHAVGYGGGWEEMLGALHAQLDPTFTHTAPTAETEGNRRWTQLLELRDTAHDLRLTRMLPGTCEQVWDAFTTRDGLATWWWSALGTSYEVDLRLGGRYRFAASSAGFAVHGTYLELTSGEHLACSWIWEDEDGVGTTDRLDLTLRPRPTGTEVEIWHRGPWTDDSQVENYRQGWTSTLDALEERLSA